jgi:hypothetical protein
MHVDQVVFLIVLLLEDSHQFHDQNLIPQQDPFSKIIMIFLPLNNPPTNEMLFFAYTQVIYYLGSANTK